MLATLLTLALSVQASAALPAPPPAASYSVVTVAQSGDTFVVETVVRVSRDRVWQAWTDPRALASWLALDADVNVSAGGRFELFWDPSSRERNCTAGCVLREVKDGYELEFTWRGPEQFAAQMNVEPLPTWVRVVLAERGPRETQVRLEHHGWGEGVEWAAAREWQQNAWRHAFLALRRHLSTAK